jgi:hypothetical protein
MRFLCRFFDCQKLRFEDPPADNLGCGYSNREVMDEKRDLLQGTDACLHYYFKT